MWLRVFTLRMFTASTSEGSQNLVEAVGPGLPEAAGDAQTGSDVSGETPGGPRERVEAAQQSLK